jgi:hypothetical protein
MSNAFNLSQLANFVDSSGKVNISTGSTGTLPTTQGGTGLTTVGTNGQILQSNGTTLSWATPSSGGVTSLNGQTGAIDNTTQYAIGSYIMGRPQNHTTYNNSTIAGSSLYAVTGGFYYGANEGGGATWRNYGAPGGGPGTSFNALVNTGSWRCVSLASQYAVGAPSQPADWLAAGIGLWVRYA